MDRPRHGADRGPPVVKRWRRRVRVREGFVAIGAGRAEARRKTLVRALATACHCCSGRILWCVYRLTHGLLLCVLGWATAPPRWLSWVFDACNGIRLLTRPGQSTVRFPASRLRSYPCSSVSVCMPLGQVDAFAVRRVLRPQERRVKRRRHSRRHLKQGHARRPLRPPPACSSQTTRYMSALAHRCHLAAPRAAVAAPRPDAEGPSACGGTNAPCPTPRGSPPRAQGPRDSASFASLQNYRCRTIP